MLSCRMKVLALSHHVRFVKIASHLPYWPRLAPFYSHKGRRSSQWMYRMGLKSIDAGDCWRSYISSVKAHTNTVYRSIFFHRQSLPTRIKAHSCWLCTTAHCWCSSGAGKIGALNWFLQAAWMVLQGDAAVGAPSNMSMMKTSISLLLHQTPIHNEHMYQC